MGSRHRYETKNMCAKCYLDVAMGDVLAVGILEALKDGLEDMTDLFFPHVDSVRVRVQVRLSQLHHKVEL